LVKVAGVPEEKLTRLKEGVLLEDGEAKAVPVALSAKGENSWIGLW
jgi:16S rRNA U516 pseudouridylate synthase RsuA-like enzyme